MNIREAKRKRDRAQTRYDEAQEAVYIAFRSRTAWKNKIPPGAIQTSLDWRNRANSGRPDITYVGYCADAVLGARLLHRLDRAEKLLAGRERQRDAVLAPMREKRKAKEAAKRPKRNAELAARSALHKVITALDRFSQADKQQTEVFEFLGVLPEEMGTMSPYDSATQSYWRNELQKRGIAVPDVPLIMQRSNKKKCKIMALGVHQGKTHAEWVQEKSDLLAALDDD